MGSGNCKMKLWPLAIQPATLFSQLDFFSWFCSIHQLPTTIVIVVKGKNIFHSEPCLQGGAVSDWYFQWCFLSCGEGESESWLPLWFCISSLVCKTGLSLLHIESFPLQVYLIIYSKLDVRTPVIYLLKINFVLKISWLLVHSFTCRESAMMYIIQSVLFSKTSISH